MTKDEIDVERKVINAKINRLMAEVSGLHEQLDALDNSIEANVFGSHEEAEKTLYWRFSTIANEACEGSHCYGEDVYTQDFKVGDELFTATVEFEYNRHDKEYYYVEGSTYSYKAV